MSFEWSSNGIFENIIISAIGGAIFATVAYLVNTTFMKGYRKDIARNDLEGHVRNLLNSPDINRDTTEILQFIREKSEVIPFGLRLTFADDLEIIRNSANVRTSLENAVNNMINNSIRPRL